MELAHVILGQLVTEKTEQLKVASKTYTLRVAPQATKVDIKKALKKYYDIDATSVRIIRTAPKQREFGRARSTMEKRHRTKKALITLAPKSKALDLTAFKTH